MKVRKYMLVALVAGGVGGGFFVGRLLAAGIPTTSALTYSGTLADASGAPLTADQNITINLWSTATPATGATPLCTVTTSGVKLTAGRFSIPLPDTCTAAVHANPDVWVDVVVGGMSLGLSKMGAVPYAAEAAHAVNADSCAAASTAAGSLATAIGSLQSSAASPWQSYSVNVVTDTASTPVTGVKTNLGFYRRVGDTIDVRIYTEFSSAPAGASGYMAWTLPTGLTIDGAKLPGQTAGFHYRDVLGPANWAALTAASTLTICQVNTSTSLDRVLVACQDATASLQVAGIGSAAEFELSFSVPVKP
jgi:hypothetical protein